jgi:preprotein translocase subunit YajC
MNTQQLVEYIRTNVDLARPTTITEAANMAIGLNNVSVGSDVAVINDPTFPTAGLKGKVKSIDNGFAYVELHDGTVVPLQINLLIAL